MKQLQRNTLVILITVVATVFANLMMHLLATQANAAVPYTPMDADVTMTPAVQQATGNPGDVITYTHVITNTGDESGSFDVSVNSVRGWAVDVEPVAIADLETGSDITATVTVTIPEEAEAGVADVTTVLVSLEGMPGTYAEATDTTTVNAVAGVTLSTAQQTHFSAPGETVTYSHRLTNTGNTTDTFTIAIVSELGWSYTLVPTDAIELDAWVGTQVQAVLFVPDVTNNITETMTMTVTSQNDFTAEERAIHRTILYSESILELTPSQQEDTAFPGTQITYTHTLRNTWQHSVEIEISAEPDLAGWSASVTPEQLSLAQNEEETITVVVTVPEDAEAGEVGETTVRARPLDGPPSAAEAVNQTEVEVEQTDWFVHLPIIVNPSAWTQLEADSWPDAQRAVTMAACSGTPELMLAGSENSLLKRAGGTWESLTTFDENSVITAILFTDDTCDQVYVSVFGEGVFSVEVDGSIPPAQMDNGDLSQVRDMIISDDILFVGGDFGVRYWENGAWTNTSVPSNNTGMPVMDLAVENVEARSGSVFAVRWLDNQVWTNNSPGADPGSWIVSGGALPDTTVRAVVGDANGPLYVGTQEKLFVRSGNSWQEVQGWSARSFLRIGNDVYVGFAGGYGVYRLARGSLNPVPVNSGWQTELPDTVFSLIAHDGAIYAGTSTGVWRYR